LQISVISILLLGKWMIHNSNCPLISAPSATSSKLRSQSKGKRPHLFWR